MQTALSAAAFSKLCNRRANDGPLASIVNSGFADKSRLNTAKQRQTAVVSPCWLVTMMSRKNREVRKARKGAHTETHRELVRCERNEEDSTASADRSKTVASVSLEVDLMKKRRN